MLVQEGLIARIRALCVADERIDAALMYGSFAVGEADAYSDVELWLFFDPGHGKPDPRGWCAQVAPLLHHVRNEFGSDVVMFSGLIRGEFHFATTAEIASVQTWPARGAPVERMIVLDRRGQLRPVLEGLPALPAVPTTSAEVDELCGRFANWLVLAHHVACRGEQLRAHDALAIVQRYLLWMARLVADRTAHWLTPSRCAERELPAHVIDELRAIGGRPDEIAGAIRRAWQAGRRAWVELARRHGTVVPTALFDELDAALATRLG